MSIYARPGATIEATVDNADTGLVGTITVGIYDGQGNVTTAPVTTGIVESPVGSGIYTATLTAPESTGQYGIVWAAGDAYASEDLTVAGSVVGGIPEQPDGPALASAEELAARLGVEFTDAQTTQAAALLGLATDAILDTVRRDTGWLEEQQIAGTVPGRLRVTCIELAVRAFANPRGATSSSETLGAHSFSESFAAGGSGIELTKREELACRRAVFGSTTGSARVGSILDEEVVRAQFSTSLIASGEYPSAVEDDDE